MHSLHLTIASLFCTFLSACGGSGQGSPLGLVAPAAPSGLTATVTGTNTVVLTWSDDAAVEAGFRIERGDNPFQVVGNVSANTTTFTDTFPPARAPHVYRVLSFNRTAASSYSSSVSITPPLPNPPSLVGVDPARIFNVPGKTVTLTGSGFANFLPGNNEVCFGGVPGAAIDTLDDSTLSVDPPSSLTGSFDVLLTNWNGTATLSGVFTTFMWPAQLRSATTRLDTGATSGISAGSVELASVDDNVYVVWSDERDGMEHVYFNRSLDGGVTWQAMDVSLDNSMGTASEPEISVAGSNIYVVWQDTRDGEEDLYVNRSLDGGLNWLMPGGVRDGFRIDTDPAGREASTQPRISSSGDNVSVAWQDARGASLNVFVNRSTDAGLTWLAEDIQVDDVFGNAMNVGISSSGDNVAVSWSEIRGTGSDILVSTSRDGGATWPAASTQVDTDGIGTSGSLNPVISSAGDNILVVWEDYRALASAIRANRSFDAGLTWLAADIRLDTDVLGMESTNPRMAREGNDILVVWEDERGMGEIRLNRSTDSGATWLAEDIVPAPGTTSPSNLQVSLQGENAFLTWEDDRSGGRIRMFFSSSPDGGTTWQPTTDRLQMNVVDILSSTSSRLSSDGARAFVVWEDELSGGRKLSFALTVPEERRSKEQQTTRMPRF